MERLEDGTGASTVANDDGDQSSTGKPSRRSSISYKRSSTGSNSSVTMNIAGLPTPEMTPTSFGRRYSNAESLSHASDTGSGGGGGTDEFFPPNPPTQSRPLSTSEQHFLFKSHNALLARITDLERALSVRRRESGGGYSQTGSMSSRPVSVAESSFSSSGDERYSRRGSMGSSEPSDEMLRLIADLKAERDELKRDVDGWRTRVNNLENQTGVLAKRVDNERRDAWVARSRVGLLEVEKGVLAKKLEAVDELLELHESEKELWDQEKKSLRKENDLLKTRVGCLEGELESVKKELESERVKSRLSNLKAQEEAEVDPMATPTPRTFETFNRSAPFGKKHGLGFMSVDSESSTTDVEPDSSDDGQRAFGYALKSVQEDDGDEDYYSEEDNGLAGYEDQEDADVSLMEEDESSSFGSEDEMPRSIGYLQQQPQRSSSPTTPTRQVFTPPKPTHVRRATLSRTWTFPKGPAAPQPAAPKEEEDDTVDRFFGCLDDGGSETAGSVPNSPSAYSYEKSKGLFSSGFKFAEDDNASFFLPPGVGVPVDEEPENERQLFVVTEEDEEEEETQIDSDVDDGDMFGEIGGIRITFTPPQEEPEAKEAKQIQVSPVKSTSPPPTLPALDFSGFDDQEEEEQEEDKGAIPFNFGRPLVEEGKPSPPQIVVPMTPPSSIPRPSSQFSALSSPSIRPASPSMIPRVASPSSIPRSASFKSPVFESPSKKVMPMRAVVAMSNLPANSFITPPTKRGGVVPSFIPQPASSPSPMRTFSAPSKPKVVSAPTFIRQPTRKPLLPSTNAPKVVGTTNGSTLIPQPHIMRTCY